MVLGFGGLGWAGFRFFFLMLRGDLSVIFWLLLGHFWWFFGYWLMGYRFFVILVIFRLRFDYVRLRFCDFQLFFWWFVGFFYFWLAIKEYCLVISRLVQFMVIFLVLYHFWVIFSYFLTFLGYLVGLALKFDTCEGQTRQEARRATPGSVDLRPWSASTCVYPFNFRQPRRLSTRQSTRTFYSFWCIKRQSFRTKEGVARATNLERGVA